MANVDNPHGLMPLHRTLSGGASTLRAYTKASNYASAIFKHDPVTTLAGNVKGPASGITPGTTYLLGVAARFSAASTLEDGNFEVYDQPDALFDVQEDGSGAANAVFAKQYYKANLTGGAGGSPTRDVSGVELDGSSIATTSTLDVTMLGKVADPSNGFGANCRFEVRINKHQLSPGVTAA